MYEKPLTLSTGPSLVVHFKVILKLDNYTVIIYVYFLPHTVKPVYSGHLGTSLKCPDYLVFQVSLHVNGYFGTITKCPDYGGVVPIFKGPD